MIRISITAAAFEAIATTLPSSVGVEQKRAANGDYHIWLEPRFVDRLRALRGPGESYSNVVLIREARLTAPWTGRRHVLTSANRTIRAAMPEPARIASADAARFDCA
jgi:hypothetical protein